MNEAWNQVLDRTRQCASTLLVFCLLAWANQAVADTQGGAVVKDEASAVSAESGLSVWLSDVLDVSRLEPAARVERGVRFANDLDTTRMLEVWRGDLDRGRDAPHACLRVFYAGLELSHGAENAISIAAPTNRTARVNLQVDADCGWTEDSRERAVPIVFRMQGEAETRTVQWLYTLQNPLELEDDVTIAVARGSGPQLRPWGPSWSGEWPRRYQVSIDLSSATTPLPNGLSVRVHATSSTNEDSKAEEATPTDTASSATADGRISPPDAALTQTISVGSDDTQPPLRFEVEADKCTTPGTYVVPVRLVLLNEDGSFGRGRTTLLTLEVTGGGLPCWWPRFALAAVVLTLLSFLIGALRGARRARRDA